MAATVELLDFLAPAVADVPEADKGFALAQAESYRPSCLSAPRQDEAQAWYAAWLLYNRLQQQAAGASVGVIPVGISSEKEGDLARTYRAGAEGGSDVGDPMGFLAQYQRLADLCGYGAITVARRPNGCECQSH
ncbi:DUF4054 domain-containing protein [Cupriavidus alkaliphilus]|uniref:DUF4054 domain-containing protein n=1 Tax=Cupriavidus alkaliphilus TaxID=942866 RepID=UPI00160D9BD3|nr:DUF4054 domain-containing protein [Cupriavidus alkaliphilus]MBB2918328.1 hypothetical protein [Cupriavidus alkaliphilus]